MLRRALHALGARFRLHRQLGQGCTPDICLPRYGIAIFVDGDYWHSCPVHGRKSPFTGPNADLWCEKMERVMERDRRSSQIAEDAGWTVVRVWECVIREDPIATAREVLMGRSPQPTPRGEERRRSPAT
jgi:DNA G:T-mismatch repair endonuclease